MASLKVLRRRIRSRHEHAADHQGHGDGGRGEAAARAGAGAGDPALRRQADRDAREPGRARRASWSTRCSRRARCGRRRWCVVTTDRGLCGGLQREPDPRRRGAPARGGARLAAARRRRPQGPRLLPAPRLPGAGELHRPGRPTPASRSRGASPTTCSARFDCGGEVDTVELLYTQFISALRRAGDARDVPADRGGGAAARRPAPRGHHLRARTASPSSRRCCRASPPPGCCAALADSRASEHGRAHGGDGLGDARTRAS